MRYIVLPAEMLDEVTQDALDYFHLLPRYSTDNSQVLMKLNNFYALFPQAMPLQEDLEGSIELSFPIYTSGTEEFENLMQSELWTSNIEENDI